MSGKTVDQAYEQLLLKEALIRAAEGSNEANTRSRAIDTLLYDVLDWDKRIVDHEKYVRAVGYADYAFMEGTSISLILEAKKAGKTFILSPVIDRPPKAIGFPLLAQESPSAQDALRQAVGYAATEGARFVAITNGHQWLLTLTYVHKQSVDQRSVFVFDSLDYIKRTFRMFWDCFSREAIEANRPANALIEVRKAPAPLKASQYIVNYPVPAARNRISNELSTVVKIVWDEIRNDEEDEEFLIQCYVEPDANQSSLAVATQLVQQRLSDDEQIRLECVSPNKAPSVIRSLESEKPIIVLGKIGHGKTTFLRYLRAVKAKQLLSKYIQIDIDFLARPDDASQVGSFIYSEVDKQLNENYGIDILKDNIARGALYTEIERYKNSTAGKAYAANPAKFGELEVDYIQDIQKDRHAYLGKVLRHLALGRDNSLALFFDNLDRRNDPIQEEAFLKASAIARDWTCLVFVCLRPGTFYRSKAFGVLDTVSPVLINVVSPRTSDLVSRRLRYAKTFAQGERLPASRKQSAIHDASLAFELPQVADFLECCADSFETEKPLGELFDAVSNGNARDLLSYVYQVLTSQHLNTDKILDKLRAGSYRMPDFEALRALLFGDSFHYDPSKSPFVNLFDIERADPSEHFSRYIVLTFLLAAPDGHPTHGYASLDSTEKYCCQLGFAQEHALATIRFLFDRKCCESKTPVDAWSESIESLKITAKGRYHVVRLANTFQYMDAISIDTPILDDGARLSVKEETDIERRLIRCEQFLKYLDECSQSIQDGGFRKQWDGTRASVAQNINAVRLRRSTRR